jgi:hypothetical protein
MDLVATSSHTGCLEVDVFPHTLTKALALMRPIAPNRDNDSATLVLSVLLSQEDHVVSEEIELARWHFRYLEDRWLLVEAKIYSSRQSVGAELPLFEEQLLAILRLKLHINASLYIGDAEKETYASCIITLPEIEGDVLAAYVPSALVASYKQHARNLATSWCPRWRCG